MTTSAHTFHDTTASRSRTDFDGLVRDAGILAARATAGLLLAGHGAQKLFGWFGGPGLEATAQGFVQSGYSPGKLFATLAGASELTGGLLLALGLLTPLAAAAVIGVMFNAIVAVHWKMGVWIANNGYELALLYGIAAVTVAFTGPGRLSVDHLLDRGRRWATGGVFSGAVALALGLGGALVVLIAR